MIAAFIVLNAVVLFQMWTAQVAHRNFVKLNESWLRSEKLRENLDNERVKSIDVLVSIGERALKERRMWMKRAVKAERRLAEARDRIPLATEGLGAAARMLETSRVFGKHGVPDAFLVMRAATERIVAHREGRGVP